MTDPGTRQRLALMRMVQQQQRKPLTEGAGGEEARRSVDRARNAPEFGQKLRVAAEKKDVVQLKELLVRVGCANELRPKAWPLLCGVTPANGADPYVKELLSQQYQDYQNFARVVGYSLTADTADTTPAVPFAKRRTLLSPEQCEVAKSRGDCYYCGGAGHFLRECPKYFLADQAKQDTVILTLLLDQYVGTDFGVWDVDQRVLHWLRALCFRMSEAVPEPALAWLVVKRVIQVTEARSAQTYAASVLSVADAYAKSLLAGMDRDVFSRNLQLPTEEVELRLRSVFRPMFGSLLALTSDDTFAPNDVVLRVWDALLWHPDPLRSLSRLLAGDVVTARKLSAKTQQGACGFSDVVRAVHALVAEFDTWSDEQQRSAIGRAVDAQS
eukprot:TRINITY_DN2944_c0_g1_i2.p2 TRINITY_DN2944_c0_g1~~TRINITY_DN2944_c0_g1_i2.p2  ORF type:complete len:384 (+),score=110.79 TRINITY_DN2944_c0_g1_i2:127-1278(+)